MSDMIIKRKDPIDLLEEQVHELSVIQQTQLEQLVHLKAQSDKLSGVIGVLDKMFVDIESMDERQYVKIEDINMPFLAMLGLMVKAALASTLVVIFLSTISFLVTLLILALLGPVVSSQFSRLFGN